MGAQVAPIILIMKKVTFNCEIIGHSGIILFQKGDQVDLWEENWEEGHYSNLTGHWVDKKLTSVSVFHDKIIGVYDPKTFKEY